MCKLCIFIYFIYFNKLFEFAQKGMPIALDKNVYYGNKSVVDSNTNMYKMRKSNLAMQLTKTGSSNIGR